MFARAARRADIARDRRTGLAVVQAFPQQMGPFSRPARPRQGVGGDPFRGAGAAVVVGNDPIGEVILLSVSGEIGSGNEPVPFDAVTYRNGFTATATPATRWVHPHDATYSIEGTLKWADGYTGGGTVTLVVGGAVWKTFDIAAEWNRATVDGEYDALAGTSGAVYVDHDDTDDHEIEGSLTVETDEPLRQIVLDCGQTIAATSPDGWWKLDETSGTDAADSSGNGLDGTYTSEYTLGQEAVCCADVAVELARAGTGQRIDIPDSFDYTGNVPFTCVACVNIEDETGGGESSSIFSTIHGSVLNRRGWRFYLTTDDGAGPWGLGMQRDEAFHVTTGTFVDTDKDYHVGVVYDGTDAHFWVDGVEVETVSASTTTTVATSNGTQIGSRQTAGSDDERFLGRLNNVLVWGRALPDSTMQNLATTAETG